MNESAHGGQKVEAQMGMLEPEIVQIKPVLSPEVIMRDRCTRDVRVREARSV